MNAERELRERGHRQTQIDALDKESQNRQQGMRLPKLPDLEELQKKLMRERELMLLTLIEEERLQSVRPGIQPHGRRLKELHGMRLKELDGMRLLLRQHGMRLPLQMRLPEHTKPKRTRRRLMQHVEPKPMLTLRQRLQQVVQVVQRVRTRPRLRRRLLRMRLTLQPGPRPRRMLEKPKTKNYRKLQITCLEVPVQL
jgi:hypothetical protein